MCPHLHQPHRGISSACPVGETCRRTGRVLGAGASHILCLDGGDGGGDRWDRGESRKGLPTHQGDNVPPL